MDLARSCRDGEGGGLCVRVVRGVGGGGYGGSEGEVGSITHHKVVNHSAAVHHKQGNVRPFNQDDKTADGQRRATVSVCSAKTAELINEMKEESKGGQGEG